MHVKGQQLDILRGNIILDSQLNRLALSIFFSSGELIQDPRVICDSTDSCVCLQEDCLPEITQPSPDFLPQLRLSWPSGVISDSH